MWEENQRKAQETQALKAQLEAILTLPRAESSNTPNNIVYDLMNDKIKAVQQGLERHEHHPGKIQALEQEMGRMQQAFLNLSQENQQLKNAIDDLRHPTEEMREGVMKELIAGLNKRFVEEIKKQTNRVVAEVRKNVAVATATPVNPTPPQ